MLFYVVLWNFNIKSGVCPSGVLLVAQFDLLSPVFSYVEREGVKEAEEGQIPHWLPELSFRGRDYGCPFCDLCI